VNAGHYFSFTPETARREILAHLPNEQALDDYDLLTVEGEIDDILDLTHWDNVRRLAEAANDDSHVQDLLEELINTWEAATWTATAMGYYAGEFGYNGLVYYSARAISPENRSRMLNENRNLVGLWMPEIRSDWKAQCLVIFSGAHLLTSIRRYRVNDEEWEETHSLDGLRTGQTKYLLGKADFSKR